MAYRGRKRGLKAFCPSGNFPGAPGNGARCPPRAGLPGRNFPACRGPGTSRVAPPGTKIRVPRKWNALFFGTPSTVSDAALYKHASPLSLFAANIRRMRPTPASIAASSQHSALPVAALFPNHPAGRPAGSARTRSRVQTLENPFLGNTLRFPPSPRPQNAAGGRPLLVGLPPSASTTAPFGPKRSNPAPFVTGRGCVYTEPTALAAGPASTAARSMLRAFWQVSVRIQSRSPRSIRRSACAPSGPAMPT